MTTEDFIIELFIRIDDRLRAIKNHSQANLSPSEVWRIWFPKLPEPWDYSPFYG